MEITGRSRILLVDDIKSNIAILAKVLKDEYDLAHACDGEGALEYVRSNPVDLILLDILMPGMDGYKVCGRLKDDARTKNIPVIFITSKSKDEDEAKGFELGAVDYITKPFSFPIVKTTVMARLPKQLPS
ncbi:MAG: response regulator [Proteobacteria bacterium]|nr:response regulator [Pseudomonadota bacterium]